MLDPLARWAQYGEKPDFAGLLTFAGQPYTEDASELEGVDVAILGAPIDELVSDRPGACASLLTRSGMASAPGASSAVGAAARSCSALFSAS